MVLPTLAEDARAGLPAMRQANLAGGSPLAFSGGGWRVGKGGQIRAESLSFECEAILVNAELALARGQG